MTRVIEEFFGFEIFSPGFFGQKNFDYAGTFYIFNETEDDPGCLECC